METQELKSAHSFGPRWAAWAHSEALAKSASAQSTYSNQQQIAATRMKLALELVYHDATVFVTYRKKFIAVKVTGQEFREGNVKELRLLEKEWGAARITKHVSPQGVIYRIPKTVDS